MEYEILDEIIFMRSFFKKRILFLIVFFFFCLIIPSFAEQRPKIGLVLDGGGALGLAHISILKMLDRNQIPVDYVVGTSMGGIIGALYSMGYSGDEIQKIAEDMDWKYFLSDIPQRSIQPYFQKKLSGKYQLDLRADGFIPVPPSGLIYGQKMNLFFSSLTTPYEHLDDFDELPIPFRCIAVDLISGKEIVLKTGSISKAMRATMSIPSLFSPVEWDDYLLIDGGLLNNLPVDVAKVMGADIVIAVDIKKPLLKREELESAFGVLEQSIKIVELNQTADKARQADFIINPDLRTYSMFDFFFKDKLRGIVEAGNEAAEKSWPALKEMLEKYNVLGNNYLKTKDVLSEHPAVQNIQIKGIQTISYDEIIKKLGIEKGKPFESESLEKKFLEAEKDLKLKFLDYQTIPLSSKEVKLVLYVKEIGIPVIKQIIITGNTLLPSSFIKRLAGLKEGIKFNQQEIENKIMKVYSFRYFTHIRYEIIHLGGNELELRLIVKESKQNSFHGGLRYDDRHKVVGLAAFNANNVLFPGIRAENEIQFIGLTRFDSTLYYPTRSFDIPVYPFLNLKYKNISTHLFDGTGNIPLNYRDRSLDIGFGVGFLFSNFINSEIGIYQEFLSLKTSNKSVENIYFPDLKDSLRKICASFTFDTLDNVLLPSQGLYFYANYEGSFKNLGSDREYQLFGLSADMYNSYQSHTVRLSGFLGFSSGSLPVYKFFKKETPSAFVGMAYDQVSANRIKIIRVDYRYRINDVFHIKGCSNLAFDVEKRFPEKTYKTDILWGIGAGILLYSPLGTAELVYGLGSRSFEFPKKVQDNLYLTLGARF